MRINLVTCKAFLKASPTDARAVAWDEEIPGFGIRRTGAGATFLLKFRVKGDPAQRLLTIGTFPAMLPDDARTRARAIKTAAQAGQDLIATEAAQRAGEAAQRRQEALLARPAAELLDAWRAETKREISRKAEAGRSPAYERELLRLEAAIIRPALGKLGIGQIDGDRLHALLGAEVRRSPSTARNLRSLLVRAAGVANDRFALEGLSLRWPTSFRLQLRGRIRSRDHRYSVDEAAALWIAAGAMGRRGALVRFLLLTACRRSEARLVEWSHLVLDDAVVGPHWQQPAHLTKNNLPHRVPLAPAAVALLRWLPPRKSRTAGPARLVFAGEGNRPIGGWTDIRRRLLELAGVDDGTLHDIRRTIVSTLGDHGFDPQVVDTLLNHAAATTMGGVMGVYQRSDFWLQRRRAIELWSELLLERVHARMQIPLCRESWGFRAPFEDVRFRRPPRRAVTPP